MTSGRHRLVAAGALAILTLASCSASSQPPKGPPKGEDPGASSLPALAESYVRVALQLAQHDPELVDGWRGPQDWRPGPRQPVAPLLAEVESLQRRLAAQDVDAPSNNRVAYLRAQLGGLHLAASRLLGHSSSFDREAREALGIILAPLDTTAIGRARTALDGELPGQGALVDRYDAFKRRLTIPAARMERVMRAALDVCRTATLSQISLPPDEAVDLVFVTGSPWDGYARYEGGHRTRIEINREASLDITRALRLACHEGYPGHHVQHVWIDDELVARRQWREFQLAPGFGRHLVITEGAAEAGVDLLFPDDKREAVYREKLLPAAGLSPSAAAQIVRIESLVASLEPAIANIVAAYLDNSLTEAAALERLREDTLLPNPTVMIAFAERRRTRVLVYPEGRTLVSRVVGNRGLAGLREIFVDQPFAVQ